MKEFLFNHGIYFVLLMIQAYAEYRKGLDGKKENSYLEVLINKIRGQK